MIDLMGRKGLKHFIILLTLFFLFVGCNPMNENGVPYVKYSFELSVIQSGYNGEWCWFHPRATRFSNDDNIILLMQPWITKNSDYYSFMYVMTSSNRGQTWSEPKSLAKSLGERNEGEIIVRICDVTPHWHNKTSRVLATGHSVRYLNGKVQTGKWETVYFHYNPKTQKWSSWDSLEMPDLPEFKAAGTGCGQWVECKNGDILLPIYFLRDPTISKYTSTVLRCRFDGETLKYLEHGDYLDFDRERGLCEPSLVEFKGDYYLTLRNDINGFVTRSKDGLHFDEVREWRFNDSSYVYSENTQQHWVKSPKALFLVYTSSRREESNNVVRGRAPLFMAQFDEQSMTLLKETETIIVPNNGAALGNFGAFDLNKHESWVTTSEAMNKQAVESGNSDGRVYVVKIKWN